MQELALPGKKSETESPVQKPTEITTDFQDSVREKKETQDRQERRKEENLKKDRTGGKGRKEAAREVRARTRFCVESAYSYGTKKAGVPRA